MSANLRVDGIQQRRRESVPLTRASLRLLPCHRLRHLKPLPFRNSAGVPIFLRWSSHRADYSSIFNLSPWSPVTREQGSSTRWTRFWRERLLVHLDDVVCIHKRGDRRCQAPPILLVLSCAGSRATGLRRIVTRWPSRSPWKSRLDSSARVSQQSARSP